MQHCGGDNKKRAIVPYLIYACIALLVFLPLLKPGFILTLDMVFTPKLLKPHNLSDTYLFQQLLHTINFIVLGQVTEKLLIFMILFVCGVSMHRLINTRSPWPKYFAGVFYMINPFTYERWMAGQYLIIAGYALLPFLFRSLLNFLANPSKKTSLYLTLWYTLLAILSVQMLVLAAFLGAVVIVAKLLSKHEQVYRRKLIGYCALAVTATFILNIYWLIGVIRGTSPISQTIDSVGNVDLSAFTTASGPHGNLLLNVLTMYGFWLERFHKYAMPNANIFLWLGIFFLLAVLIALGIRAKWRKERSLTTAFLVCALIAFIMACGINAPLFGPLVRWVILHVPLMKGFREPEKFSALLVFVYVYFAAYGLDWLLVHFKNWSVGKREVLAGAAIALPLVYVSTMLFGFAGQLKPVNYPTSWYSFNNQLLKHPATGKVLFLPWNEYMSYGFSPRVIANPAPGFFYNASIVSGTDADFGGVLDPNPTPTSLFIENRVLSHTDQDNLGAVLATRLHVQYVLLANGYGYTTYTWLTRQHDLKLISNKPGLEVFVNEAFHHG